MMNAESDGAMHEPGGEEVANSSHSIAAWEMSDSFRETTLVLFRSKDRKAIRRVGRILYDLALETVGVVAKWASTRRELGAVGAELRYLEGYLDYLGKLPEHSTCSASDEAYARFARQLAKQVGALAAATEEEVRKSGRSRAATARAHQG